MNSRPSVDKDFSNWLITHSIPATRARTERTFYSIAIESPCLVCQPRVAHALAVYLNEFDDNDSCWLPVTDHRLEQLQAHRELREMLQHETPSDPDSAIQSLCGQGGVILELPKCHKQTSQNKRVFQVSMSCQEPSDGNHHLWVNAKRIPETTLVLMIANAFFDWASNGGDRQASKAPSQKNS